MKLKDQIAAVDWRREAGRVTHEDWPDAVVRAVAHGMEVAAVRGARMALEAVICPVTLLGGAKLCHEATRCRRCRLLKELE